MPESVPPPHDASSAGLLRRAAVVFLPLAIVAALVILALFGVLILAAGANTRSAQENLVRLGRQEIAGELGAVFSDARYLARERTLQRWLRVREPAGREALAQNLLAFVSEKRIYDQVRFIDLEGRELARADWNGGDPAVVPEGQLRDRIGPYYVDSMKDLNPGQVYVSRFDLNVENGAVEQPPKPVIRFGAPVYDESGRRRATVLLNYLGQPLLERLAQLPADNLARMWLINADGHWLVGPDSAAEWRFMFPDREQVSAATAHPQAWEHIRGDAAEGQFRADGGLFTFARISPTVRRPLGTADAQAPLQGPVWYVVSHVPAAVIAAALNDFILVSLAAFVVLALVLAGVAVLMARQQLRRERAEALLRASDARFRHLLESAPDAVVIADEDGRIDMVNAQAETLFGRSRKDLVGEAVETLLPDRYHDVHVKHRRTYVEDPRLRPMGEGLELNGRRADGSEFPVEISLSPVPTERGLLILADIRDVTERRAQERKIQELNSRLSRDNAELAAVNEELEAFSYSVSHDLRAPLRAIDGFSQALLEDSAEALDADARGHLDRVRSAAQRMGHLIDDLLKLSRVARAQLDLQETDLSALANDVVADLRARDPERRVEVHVEDNLQVEADPRLLHIALENLLGNAWKFTAECARAIIELGRTQRDGEDVLYLRDNGVGFDMRYVDQLFRAFQRLHDSRVYPGTGIGLATVQRIVHKHGGRIWAEAEPGQGAVFYFTL